MDSSDNALWDKIDILKKQREEGLELIEACYGALKGLTWGEFDGVGGAEACIKDACYRAEKYLNTGKITNRDIRRRSKRRVIAKGGKWLTAQEVCEVMDISDSSLRRLIREGKPHPPYIKFFSSIRFPDLEFKNWTKKNLTKKRRVK